VDPLAALIGQLHELGRGAGDDPDELSASVQELTARMTAAVPSFLGVTVTMPGETGRLTLTAVGPPTDRPACTSLSFSVPQRDGGTGRITAYAHQPGTFVDLHADLTYLHETTRHQPGRSRAAVLEIDLDRDLPAPSLVPGLVGLDERSTLDRAEGALINQGADPDDAQSQLRRQATAAGMDPHTYARQLLDALSGRS
jgi:hypothetical protein